MFNPFPRPASGQWPPDYTAIFAWRQRQLLAMRDRPALLYGALEYYARPENCADFIEHWMTTYDPRNAASAGKLSYMPFILFTKQRELVTFIYQSVLQERSALIEKCRDMGATWLAGAVSVHIWRFMNSAAVGWGSRKQELVDELGVIDSIFEKLRVLIRQMPREFHPKGFNVKDHMPFMRIINPENGATITGEVGDNIGRGGRKLIYFKDEAQPLDARVLTPLGWSTMREMRVGSSVIGPDGKAHRVTHINDCGTHPVYRFTFTDGTSVESSPNHLWRLTDGRLTRSHQIATDFRHQSPSGHVHYKYRIPVTDPVEFFPRGLLPLDPYIVGALLGDGSIKHVPKYRPSFTSADYEIAAEIARLLPEHCCITKANDAYTWRIGDKGRRRGKGKISRASLAIMNAGIAGFGAESKHIPDAYKFASVQDRLSLLQGLMDTDGSASGGVVSFHTISPRLADDVRFLVQSLGGTATYNVKPDRRGFKPVYVLHMTLPFVPFRLSRKIKSLRPRKHPPGRTIVSVELLSERPVRCITIDAVDGLYLTDHCVVTHNSAHYERPEKIEAALSENTRVQVDISSVNGLGNVFHRRREAGFEWSPETGWMIPRSKVGVFIMDWRDHPEKTEQWYKEKKERANDEGLGHLFAQEVDRNYAASVEGTIIQLEWVRAAIGLELDDEGPAIAALDVADEGADKHAFVDRKGPVLRYAESWGEGDPGKAARKAVGIMRQRRVENLQYDSIGVGAAVKAETNRLREEPETQLGEHVMFVPWNAAAAVLYPEQRMIIDDWESPKNKDYFQNLKAQGWWQLARRFERTYRHVTEGREYDPGELISISKDIPAPTLRQLEKELCQVVAKLSPSTLKMVIDKSPDGVPSPNLADGVVMAYWPLQIGALRYSARNIG